VRAVVRTAVDVRRAGIAVPILRATLEGLFDPYLVDEGGIPADTNEVFEKAVERASRPIGRYQRLLEPQSAASGRAYVPYDALVYHIDQPAGGPSPPLLAEAWEAALEFPGSHFGVGVSAYFHSNRRISERAYRTGIELGHGGAASNLGVLFAQQGKIDNATEAFCTAFDLLGAGPETKPIAGVLLSLQEVMQPPA
jgi:hypothetical protein